MTTTTLSSVERKPHVVYAIYDASAGGAVLSITRRQAEYLANRGYDVSLVTNSRDVSWRGVSTQTIPVCDSTVWKIAHRLAETYSRRLPRAMAPFSLRKFVDQFRFPFSAARAIAQLDLKRGVDGVVACQHVLAIGLKQLRDRTGTPFVIMSHGDIFEHPPGSFSRAITWLYRKGAKETSRTADGIITVSQGLRSRAISLGASPERVAVLYNGVELTEIESDATQSATRRASFQILAVGRLSAEKGMDVLLKAMSLLPHSGLHLRIVGVGPEDKKLDAMVKDLLLQNRVEFLGAVPRSGIAACYRDSDVLVIPSRSEAMPLVALEAMACGTPIIATRVGGLPEVIEHAVSGLLVDSEDPAGLAAAIQLLKRNDDLRQRLSLKGLERVRDFTWESLLERYEELIRHYFRHDDEPSESRAAPVLFTEFPQAPVVVPQH